MKNLIIASFILALSAAAPGFISDRPPGDPAPIAPTATTEEQLNANGVVESNAPSPYQRTESLTVREDTSADQKNARKAIQGFLANDPQAAQTVQNASRPAGPQMPQWLTGAIIAAALLGSLAVGFRWYAEKHAPKMPEIKPSAIEKI